MYDVANLIDFVKSIVFLGSHYTTVRHPFLAATAINSKGFLRALEPACGKNVTDIVQIRLLPYTHFVLAQLKKEQEGREGLRRRNLGREIQFQPVVCLSTYPFMH